jgi:phosphoenolpyruvate phosphomutase
MTARGLLPEERRGKLKELLLRESRAIRLMECHNGLSAIVANNASARGADGEKREFDGLWISGLSESASRGLPDIELQGMLSRVALIREISGVTDKPIVVDGDTGGTIDQLQYFIRTLEADGVSALIIEDKVFPKNNSLDHTKAQVLEDPEIFARKIEQGKAAQRSKDFLLIARTEALVAGDEMGNALMRAERYALAGADAIVIHSRSKSPDEVLEFSRRFQEICASRKIQVPLVSIPTIYNSITERELYKAGFRMVIHANHLMRSAYLAMQATAEKILAHDRSLEVESQCVPLATLFQVIEGARNGDK